jgi:DNA repair photolyase
MLLLPPLRVGPVRLARQGPLPLLDQRVRGTRFLAHSARSVLNPPESTGIGCWSLNPYVGCEFGCTYCYARFAHRYVVERARDAGRLTPAEFGQLRGPRGWDGFEHQIFVKQRPAVLAALERDLARVQGRYRRGRQDPLLIGTATDPYQPAERRFGITRAVLERLAQAPPLHIGLITKSPLVTRDTDLLSRLAARHRLTVHVSLISTLRRLIRMFEPRSPMPHARLRAVRRLVAAGINAGVLVAPILPGITDGTVHLRQLLRAAKEHGARFAHPSPLRLYAAVRPVLLPVLQRQFPTLVPRYLAAYQRAEEAPREYARGLKERFARIALETAIATDDRFGTEAQPTGSPPQLALWNDTSVEEP